ncbi:MAG TPA: DUF1048 domain-containing protein [Clostridia bacterium]|nr:DUF1048 domain-containing protein [Clostridia bacterium]
MKLQEMIQQKKQWRAHMRRVKQLPRDYQIVYTEMQKYIFLIGTVEYEGTMGVLSGIVDLLAEGAAAGKDVLDVTGRDVAGLCDELVAGMRTYADISQDETDRAVLKAMEKEARKEQRKKE